MNPQPTQTYDYIFCGAGASAYLLMLSMHERGLFKEKNVLLIDKEEKNRRDKTFCFWSKRDESIERSLQDLISHSWSSVILPNKEEVQLDPLSYHHVSSLDLYRKIDVLAADCGWKRLAGAVDEIVVDENNFCVHLGQERIIGKMIFDSRTPTFQTPKRHESHLHQSFIGWRIALKSGQSFPAAFRFMDFEVNQLNATQFVYVLPFGDGSAMVELTRFGTEQLNATEADVILNDYIRQHYGEFIKLDEEQGCIPMCTAPILDSTTEGVVQLGARNYAIKASTGYAFKRMFYHAEDVASALASGASPTANNQTHAEVFRGRFAFYDSLLLDILTRTPDKGKPIFESLFKHNKLKRILTFLDEQSDLKDEFVIFSRLPLMPFLKALWRRIQHHQAFVPAVLLALCALFMALPQELSQALASITLIIGLVTIGIPHGALDHLLETRQLDSGRLPGFIVKYLSIGAVMALLWFLAPSISVLLFVLYSAWHFGQADGKQWSMNAALSLAWGASVLVYILGTHMQESNAILTTMSALSLPFGLPVWVLSPWIIFFLFKRNLAGVLTTSWLLLSSQLPLMFAFGLYFIGQHSLTGWKHIQSHLGMSHQRMWLHALPFHLGAWLLLGVFSVVISTSGMASELFTWGNFFIFLACISLPHALAMQGVYKYK
ncbi:MAG: beta-carotene 15,15'-dioxygenase, Brp/Blh family [Flavobacteriales bacterium]|jgi:lycopene beta-cyclase